MTRPYLHMPLPHLLRCVFRRAAEWRGWLYTPWSPASREVMLADALRHVERAEMQRSHADEGPALRCAGSEQ